MHIRTLYLFVESWEYNLRQSIWYLCFGWAPINCLLWREDLEKLVTCLQQTHLLFIYIFCHLFPRESKTVNWFSHPASTNMQPMSLFQQNRNFLVRNINFPSYSFLSLFQSSFGFCVANENMALPYVPPNGLSHGQ